MSDRGSATVELALLVPVILLVLAMLVEVAVVGRVHIEMIAAAREGARVAAVSPDPARALSATSTALGSVGAEARINVHRPHVVGGQARVTVTLVHRLRLPLLDQITVPLSATAVMRVER